MLIRRYGPLLHIILTLAACTSSPTRPTASAPPDTPTPVLGAACVSAVRDEFVRQQSVVHWHVYCPALLPDGFRLARPDDAPDPNALGGDAAPTLDDLNPGGGTFITRLVGPDDAALVIVQGAGASIYVRRDASGNMIGAAPGAPDAPWGGLAGKSLDVPSPSVTAFDSTSYGHMIIATNVTLDATKNIAQAMHVVDPSPVRTALFSLGGLHSIDERWVVAFPPDRSGEDVTHPSICDNIPASDDRLSEVAVRFEPARRPDAPGGALGAFLQHAVLTFPSGDARHYLDAVAAILDQCPASYERKNADGSHAADVTTTPLTLDVLGDQSVAFRRSTRTNLETADVDIAIIRRADTIAVVLRYELAATASNTPPDAILPYARLADDNLRALQPPALATP